MNKQTLLAATVLIVMAAGAIAVFQASGRPDLRGTWASSGCDITQITDTRSYFMKRSFTFTAGTWKRTLEAYLDYQCLEKFYTVTEGGTYEIGDKNKESEAFNIHYSIESVELTPNNSNMTQALSQAKCADKSWALDETQNVSGKTNTTNCLNIFSIYDCRVSKEMIKRDNDTLSVSKFSLGCMEESESASGQIWIQLKKSQ